MMIQLIRKRRPALQKDLFYRKRAHHIVRADEYGAATNRIRQLLSLLWQTSVRVWHDVSL